MREITDYAERDKLLIGGYYKFINHAGIEIYVKIEKYLRYSEYIVYLYYVCNPDGSKEVYNESRSYWSLHMAVLQEADDYQIDHVFELTEEEVRDLILLETI